MISSNRLKPAEQHPDPGSATPRPMNLLNNQHDSELRVCRKSHFLNMKRVVAQRSLWAPCTVDAARTQQSRQISSLQPQMCFSSRWFFSLLTTVTLSAASMSAQQILASRLIGTVLSQRWKKERDVSLLRFISLSALGKFVSNSEPYWLSRCRVNRL